MSLSDYERNLLSNVAEHGWQCLCVGAGDESPAFAYTIGFWETVCTPELIVFGLDFDLMHNMLWLMFDELKGGARLVDGARWPVLAGHDCISRPVHPSRITREYFNSALWYKSHRTGERTIEAYQLFWPGKQQGLFPWEKGCEAIVRDLQPRLDLPAGPGIA